MRKIVIVIAYYDRQEQLNNTLKSFLQYNPDDFEVVIVDNASDKDIVPIGLPFKVTIKKITDKSLAQVCITYNIGFHEALKSNPEIIIMNGAECSHKGDLLSVAKTITDNNYLTFGCYSLAQNESDDNVVIQNREAMADFESAWYNHPTYRPVAYNFCSAITASNLKKLNGFDERFLGGVGYEDNYFLHQVKKLGLRVDITDYPFVFHQWHMVSGERTAETWSRNMNLYKELIELNTYKAVHTITPDL